MRINSIDKLKKVQEQIRVIIQRYNLESVLLSLRESAQQFQFNHSFITANIALFAFRYCTAGHKTKTVHALKCSNSERNENIAATSMKSMKEGK